MSQWSTCCVLVLEMTIIPAEVRCHKNKQSTFLQDRWVFNPPDVLLRHWLARTDRESVSVQAYLLKNDENKALKPAALQEELNNMLKFNPDFAEAVRFINFLHQQVCWRRITSSSALWFSLSPQHYLNYLNSMRVQDIFLSAHSLLHYFDRLILSGNEGKSNGDEGYGRSLRYAALNLASLHCRFGH